MSCPLRRPVALPRELPYKDAVYNVSRVGLLPAAMNPVVLAQAAQQGKSGVAAAPAQDADTCACSGGTRESAFADELGGRSGPVHALLFTATQDKLHQPYRGALMPPSTELIALFRSKGYAAAVSGAGPCVLVLHYGNAREAIDQIASEQLASGHWRVLHLPINTAGVEIRASLSRGEGSRWRELAAAGGLRVVRHTGREPPSVSLRSTAPASGSIRT